MLTYSALGQNRAARLAGVVQTPDLDAGVDQVRGTAGLHLTAVSPCAYEDVQYSFNIYVKQFFLFQVLGLCAGC